MTVFQALSHGEQVLEEAKVTAPRLTASALLCHTLSRDRSYLYAHPEDTLTDELRAAFEMHLARRRDGMPTQYITGVQEFYGREFRVTPDVMIPRPETEHVVETALRVAGDARRMVDAGAGSGAIAVTLQLESGARMLATDISRTALAVAAGNARSLGATVEFLQCDLLSAVAGHTADLVVSNPPYVPQIDGAGLQREVRDFEPHLALFGGASGLDFHRRLITESPRVLRPGGWLVMELGIRQLGPVQDMLGDRWSQTLVVDDLAGLPRVLATRYWP